MSEWVGFTDADLQRMKNNMSDGGKGGTGSHPSGAKIVKPITGGRHKPGSNIGQRQQRKQNPRTLTPKSPKEQGDISQAAMLSKPLPKKVDAKRKVVSPPTTPSEQMPLHGKTSPTLPDSNETAKEDEVKNEPIKEPEIVEDTEIIRKKEKLQLDDIQRRQKEMEEKNKRKKTMLTKAIAERRKKASAESHKLLKIQAELLKLDEMLNYDVSIVRDKIDTACWEYNHAQKRFEKAEAEYVDAKINLHKATEMKEELTDHLYKLIQLNEERKANKLEELMQKLDLEETSDPAEVTQDETTQVLTPAATAEPKTSESSETGTEQSQEKSGASEEPPAEVPDVVKKTESTPTEETKS